VYRQDLRRDGVDHSVKVEAESVYEAALKDFERFDRLRLAKDDGCLIVEVYEEPTVHRIQVEKMFGSLKASGRNSTEETKKPKLRELVKLSL